MDAENSAEQPAFRLGKRHIFGAVFLLLLVLLLVAWWQRIDIADRVVRNQFEINGVPAQYEIEDIGFRTQKIRNLVIGDPKNPDLTAKNVEIDLAIGFGTPQIRTVRADGVRLKGRFADGKFSFGALDRFRDPNSKEPFTFPDLKVLVEDAVLSLQTPWGGVGVAIEGRGHLQRAFTGAATVRARQLSGGGCTAVAPRFNGEVRIRDSQPILDGPLTSAKIDCPNYGLSTVSPEFDGEIRLSQKFDRWLGNLAFSAGNVRHAGTTLGAPVGTIRFDGGRDRTNVDLALDRASYRDASLAIRQLAGTAEGRISTPAEGMSVSLRGEASASDAVADASMLSALDGIARGTAATPVGPVTAQLRTAMQSALRGFNGRAAFDAQMKPGKTAFLISGARLDSRSGAVITQSGPLNFTDGQLRNPLSFAFSGGGLPQGQLALRPDRGGWAGNLSLSPYQAKGGSLALPKLAFAGGNGRAWTFNGQATLSGPLMGGRLEGLSLPVDGAFANGTFTMLQSCRSVSFTSFRTGSLYLPGQTLRACPDGGSIIRAGRAGTRFALTSPALAGNARLGSTPVQFSGSQIRFSLDRGLAASNVAVTMGTGDSVTRLKMASLAGDIVNGGMRGTLAGGDATIGQVPLLAENAAGQWSFVNSVLQLDASLTVSDAEQVDRFKTLNVPDLSMTLENGVITAMGHLHEPTTGIRIADADIRHDLGSGDGRALLAVEGLAFNERLQPEMLTPLTLGAIANVEGVIAGDGRIQWSRDGVTSSGRFGTKSLDFAAAFGPVTGLSTEIEFTDLLGLVTAPAQTARIAVANPGIPAFDGQIRYQLLPDQKVKVEGGRWPFYGGELVLEPTVLDFDVEKARNLTFRLVGLDAEKFLAGYDLENLKVSGVFDGVLPMVFDQEGGRIVGGYLVSRAPGGEVSYLGQLSYEDMGAFANFAFEALRSIQFNEMKIGVEGDLGGEIVTEVQFRGLQQGSTAKRNFFTKQIAKLPIEFNIRIQAEFLSLIGSVRALYDAEYAAQRYQGLIDVKPPVTEDIEGPK